METRAITRAVEKNGANGKNERIGKRARADLYDR